MVWSDLIVYFVLSGLLAGGGTWGLIHLLPRLHFVDSANARSSHVGNVPRGGGLAILIALVCVWAFSLGRQPAAGQALLLPIVLACGLGLFSFVDDRRSLHPGLRLAAQMIAVALALWALPAEPRILPAAIPLGLERLALGLVWLWFINLFNFMDGIDGISGVEALSILAGLLVLGLILPLPAEVTLLAVIVAGGAVGFLIWNWAPAKIFLGDIGSIALGFLLGWMLLRLALLGIWWAALILPAYYWADATITLMHRLMRGEKIWQPHRRHFYQQAARQFGSHAQVCRRLAGLNLLLVFLVVFAASGPYHAAAALLVSLGLCAALLWYFREGRAPVPSLEP